MNQRQMENQKQWYGWMIHLQTDAESVSIHAVMCHASHTITITLLYLDPNSDSLCPFTSECLHYDRRRLQHPNNNEHHQRRHWFARWPSEPPTLAENDPFRTFMHWWWLVGEEFWFRRWSAVYFSLVLRFPVFFQSAKLAEPARWWLTCVQRPSMTRNRLKTGQKRSKCLCQLWITLSSSLFPSRRDENVSGIRESIIITVGCSIRHV